MGRRALRIWWMNEKVKRENPSEELLTAQSHSLTIKLSNDIVDPEYK